MPLLFFLHFHLFDLSKFCSQSSSNQLPHTLSHCQEEGKTAEDKQSDHESFQRILLPFLTPSIAQDKDQTGDSAETVDEEAEESVHAVLKDLVSV